MEFLTWYRCVCVCCLHTIRQNPSDLRSVPQDVLSASSSDGVCMRSTMNCKYHVFMHLEPFFLTNTDKYQPYGKNAFTRLKSEKMKVVHGRHPFYCCCCRGARSTPTSAAHHATGHPSVIVFFATAYPHPLVTSHTTHLKRAHHGKLFCFVWQTNRTNELDHAPSYRTCQPP